jgi:PAS domain S-box-containing protein
VSEIITPGSFDLAFKTLKEELAEEKKKDKDLARSKRIELEHIHKDGNVFWVEVTVTFTRDADGKATGVLGVCREISRRKKIEDALRESEERFRSLVECASDWIWEVDENAKYTYASPKVKDILGYEPQEVLGKTPFDLMPPGERERIRSLYTSVVKTKKAFECLENTNVRKDGKIVVLETSGVPIFDAKGKFRGYRGIDRDITERKKTESKSSR